MPVILVVLRRLRQEDSKFETNLGSMLSSKQEREVGGGREGGTGEGRGEREIK